MRVLIFVVLLGLGGCIQFGRADAGDATGDSSADAAAVVMLPWLCEDGSGPSECCSSSDCQFNGKAHMNLGHCVHGVCVQDCLGVECCEGNDGACTPSLPYCIHNECASTCLPECGDRVCGDAGDCGGPNACGECAPGLTCSIGQCKSLPK